MGKRPWGKDFVVFYSSMNVFLWIMAFSISNSYVYRNSTAKVLAQTAISTQNTKVFPHGCFALYGIMLKQLIIDSYAVVTLLLIVVLHKF